MESNNIKVSICCMTYNHEMFIKQCLDGFVMQNTDFDFEILIHDDASTDNTAKILHEYEVNYPKILKPIYQKVNQFNNGGNKLVDLLFPMSKGKYISLCEGDDYWTDPYKLQKQVDFLEANEDFAISGHLVNRLRDNVLANSGEDILGEPGEFTLENLLTHNFIPTLSMVFRRNAITAIPDWFYKAQVGDWVLGVLAAQHGKIKMFPEVMGTYREHSNGVWAYKNGIYKTLTEINTLRIISKHIPEKYQQITNNKISEIEFKLCQLYLQANKFSEFEELIISLFSSKNTEGVLLANKISEKITALDNEINSLNTIIENYKNSASYKIGNRVVKIFNSLKLK